MAALNAGGALQRGEELRSDNGAFVLLLQSDGNLVLYRVDGQQSWPLWATATTDMQSLWMQPDGNLVGARVDGTATFATNSGGHAGAFLELQDDGNLIIWWDNLDGDRRALWQLGSAPAHKLDRYLSRGEAICRSGEIITGSNGEALRLQADGNLVAYSAHGVVLFATHTAGSAAERFQFQHDGNAVLVSGTGVALWSSKSEGGDAVAVSVDEWGLSIGDLPKPPKAVVGGGGDGIVNQDQTVTITITARVGKLGTDPNLTATEVAGLSLQRFDVYANLPVQLSATSSGVPRPTLQQSFTFPKPATFSPAANIDLRIGVPDRPLNIAVEAIRRDLHASGDQADLWRASFQGASINLGDADLELELDVDYGPRPDGLADWVIVPNIVRRG